jgi:Zn-dependent membrane protease YugP
MAFVALLVILGVVVLPYAWVKWTIDRHGAERTDLPGTGGELARHLLNHFDLTAVKVEITDSGDHYDPRTKTLRLLRKHYEGKSLSAAAIAAHEVAHAIQDGRGERLLALRQNLAAIATQTDRIAGVFFIAAPILTIVVRSPVAFFGLMAVGVALLGVRVVFSLVTLPVEIDASFRKALPILKEGRYLDEKDMKAAKSVLRAAAFTYVAAALISLVNLARWIRLLR